jgi:hypothetical protein
MQFSNREANSPLKHAQRTHDLNQNGRRQREKNPPAQPRENFFPPQTRVCLFSATRARSIRVAI